MGLISNSISRHSTIVPKEENSGVMGERNSTKSTDMKYQFNKIFWVC